MSNTDINLEKDSTGKGSKKTWTPDGTLIQEQEWDGPMFHQKIVRIGTTTVDYRKKKQTGTLPVNDFTFLKESWQSAYGFREWQVPNVGREVQNGLIDVPWNFSWGGDLNKSSIDDRAIYKAFDKLKNRDVDLSIMFGERKETARLFVDAFDRMHDSWRAGARKDWKRSFDLLFGYSSHLSTGRRPRKAPSISRDTANNWLQWQFGVMPIVKDLRDSATAIAKSMERNPPRGRVSASVTGSYNLIEDWSGIWGIPTQMREWGNYTRKYVLYFSEEGVLPTLTGLGLTNPIATVYELTALSFVLDWFYNIGAYLDALDAHIGLAFENGCTTAFERRTRVVRGSGGMTRIHLYGQPGGFTTGSISSSRKLISCERRRITTFPIVPLPTLRNPLTKDASGLGRGVTLSALIRQRLKT